MGLRRGRQERILHGLAGSDETLVLDVNDLATRVGALGGLGTAAGRVVVGIHDVHRAGWVS